MKFQNSLFILAVAGVVLALSFACSNDTSNVEIEARIDAAKATIEDFQMEGLLWTQQQADSLITSGKLGQSPEAAFVPVYFDENGALVSAAAYIAEFNPAWRYYITTLEAFAKLTSEETANPEYADILGNFKERPIYAYDPYSSIQQTRIEKEQMAKERISTFPSMHSTTGEKSGITNLFTGDIIGRGNSPQLPGTSPPPGAASGWGHAGIVTVGYSHSSLSSLLYSAFNMEAVGSGIPLADQIQQRRTSVYWSNFAVGHRYRLRRTSLTAAQRAGIVNFVVGQDADAYSATALKLYPCSAYTCSRYPRENCCTSNWANGSEWYCSLLAWQAYYFATGLNIDSNGGVIVYPNDILNSSLLSGVTF